MKLRVLLAIITLFSTTTTYAQEDVRPIRFARRPSLSPDSKRIAFDYQGDIWSVPSEGGSATRLTLHEAHDAYPSWSPDGRHIAFSSKREGNYDVFVIPANGGKAKQLTHHSSPDMVMGWSPDGSSVLFISNREVNRTFSVYAVNVTTGASRLVAQDESRLDHATFTPDGKAVLCSRGGDHTRKRYRGSANSDIIQFPTLTTGPGSWVVREKENERSPVVTPDAKTLYYVSDKSGTFNLWKRGLAGGRAQQVTNFADDNVLNPSVSKAGDKIVFEHNFGIWLLPTAGGAPVEIKIFAPSDDRTNPVRRETMTTGAQEAAISPDGKQVALVLHGEIFVQTIGSPAEPTRITATAAREEDVVWSPDSKSLAFASDRTGNSEIYIADVKTKTAKQITTNPGADLAPTFSPDGKKLAFLRGANGVELCVTPVEGGEPKVLVSDPSISDVQWSPDSKWIAYGRMKSHSAGQMADVFIISVNDPKPINVSRYPEVNSSPQWSADGKYLFYLSNRLQRTNLYAVRLQDPRKIDDEEDGAGGRRPTGGPASVEKKSVEVKIDLEDIHLRARSITSAESAVGAYAVAPDSRSVAFVMPQLGRPDLWRVGVAGGQPTRLTQTGEAAAALQFAPDGSTLYYASRGAMKSLALNSPAPTPATVAYTAKMEIDVHAELFQMFDEAWRKMRDNFYDEKMHGSDWVKVRDHYRPIVADITYKEDFQALFAFVLGELNASHLGLVVPPGSSDGLTTATLGVSYDESFAGPGVKVRGVMPKGPADRPSSQLLPGDIILQVDGQDVTVNEPFYRLLGDKVGKTTELTVSRSGKTLENKVKIRPITSVAYKALEYDRWTKEREQITEKVSGGKLGYLHLTAMNDENLERFRRNVFGDLHDKAGLVLDVRFNGGGSIADELLAIIQDKIFSYRTIRGDKKTSDAPIQNFTKPIIVLINEASYSNAEAFPWGFKDLKLGKVVGVPTYGAVIGTGGTTLIDGSTLRLPVIGAYTLGGINMENNGCPPDLYVEQTPDDVFTKRDRQLEIAIAELLKEAKK